MKKQTRDSRFGCRGNIVLNTVFTLLVIFVFVFITFFGNFLFAEMSADIMPDLEHNESKEALIEVETRYAPLFSSLILIVIIGFWVLVIASAMLSTEHPILFILLSILMLFVIIASMLFANFYEEFWDDTTFAGTTSDFPLANFIMLHFMELNIAIYITALIVTFAKSRS